MKLLELAAVLKTGTQGTLDDWILTIELGWPVGLDIKNHRFGEN